MLLEGKTIWKPGLSWTTNPHIRVSHSFLYILRCPRARLLHASFRLSIFFLHIALIRPPYDQPFPLLLYHVLFLTAEVPVVLPSAHHIYFLTSSALSLGSHRQFRASLLSIYRAPSLLLCDSVTSLRHFFITTLLSFLILIDVTSCATSCLSLPARTPRLFLLHSLHYPSGCIASARLYGSNRCASLFSPFRCIHLFSLLSQLVTSRCSPSSSLSLFPSVPVLVRLFDCVSLAFPYLYCVSSRRGLIPADSSPLRRLRHAGLSLTPFSTVQTDISFTPYHLPCRLSTSLSFFVKLSEFSSVYFASWVYVFIQTCPISSQDRLYPSFYISLFLIDHELFKDDAHLSFEHDSRYSNGINFSNVYYISAIYTNRTENYHPNDIQNWKWLLKSLFDQSWFILTLK